MRELAGTAEDHRRKHLSLRHRATTFIEDAATPAESDRRQTDWLGRHMAAAVAIVQLWANPTCRRRLNRTLMSIPTPSQTSHSTAIAQSRESIHIHRARWTAAELQDAYGGNILQSELSPACLQAPPPGPVTPAKNRIKLKCDLEWPWRSGRSRRRWYDCSVDSWQTSSPGGAICHYLTVNRSLLLSPGQPPVTYASSHGG